MTLGDDLPALQKTRCYHYPKSQAIISYTLALTFSKMEVTSPQRALPWPSGGPCAPTLGRSRAPALRAAVEVWWGRGPPCCQQEPCSQKKPVQRCACCRAAAGARSWAGSSLARPRGTSSGHARPVSFLAVTVVLARV